MGGGVSVDTRVIEQTDYDTLKQKVLEFNTAYNELNKKNNKGDNQQSNAARTSTSINTIALLQLCHNLKENENEKTLAERRKEYLKSKSLPVIRRRSSNNLKEKQRLELKKNSVHNILTNQININSVASATIKDVHSNNRTTVKADEKTFDDRNNSTQSTSIVPDSTNKTPRPKPNLFLQVDDDHEMGNQDEKTDDNHQVNIQNSLQPIHDLSSIGSVQAILSPHGTLLVGQIKIQETGIVNLLPDYEQNKSNWPQHPHHISKMASKKNSLLDTSSNKLIVNKNMFNGSSRFGSAAFLDVHPYNASTDDGDVTNDTPIQNGNQPIPLSALRGKKDFIEIAALGSGASGVVSEAIHVPSLTIVALKMLPVYNQEKRQHVSRELTVLYKNLAEMELVDQILISPHAADDPLNPNSNDNHSNSIRRKSKCPNVLSLYNAFLDPKSGMINLVIEYMDGGSLEDLVKQGGCSDEHVLRDIGYQSLNGLKYLHENHSVHRDIKPANILCSSSGLIKIADFGISKALDDKSSGFAKSFIGTVCYMSPERITGESYSYSSDIWSIGLTLLTVAHGRFPFSGAENQSNQQILNHKTNGKEVPSNPQDNRGGPNQIIGGAGGYWAMISAICDEDAPAAGPSFSLEFNKFIKLCLEKRPQDRPTAVELLKSAFILEHHGHHKTVKNPSESFSSSNEDDPLVSQGVHTDLLRSSSRKTTSTSTPLSSRLTVAIARRGSKELRNNSPELLHAIAQVNAKHTHSERPPHSKWVREQFRSECSSPMARDKDMTTHAGDGPHQNGSKLSGSDEDLKPIRRHSASSYSESKLSNIDRIDEKWNAKDSSPIAMNKPIKMDEDGMPIPRSNEGHHHHDHLVYTTHNSSTTSSPKSSTLQTVREIAMELEEEDEDDEGISKPRFSNVEPLESQDDEGPQPVEIPPEQSIVNAIRLEHLDRVLDRIAKKLTIKDRSGKPLMVDDLVEDDFSSSDDDDFTDEDDEEGDDGDVQGEGEEGKESNRNSVYSIDDDEVYGNNQSIKQRTVSDQFDNDDIMARKGIDFHTNAQIKSEAKESNPCKSSTMDEEVDDVKPPSIPHPIMLKNVSTSFNRSVQFNDGKIGELKDTLDTHHPAILATNHHHSMIPSGNLSGHSSSFIHTLTNSKYYSPESKPNPPPLLRGSSRGNSMKIIPEESSGVPMKGSVPMDDKTLSLRDKRRIFPLTLNVMEDDDESTPSAAAAVAMPSHPIDHNSSVHSISSLRRLQEKQNLVEEYKRIIPKLDRQGKIRWERLANQFHLPLHLVVMAVRSKLGTLIDLREDH